MMSRTDGGSAAAWLCVTTAAVLAACGGGGGSAPAAPTAVTISGKAVDGPLQGATACYDLNDNAACDSGEPSSAPTVANGSFSIEVPAEQAGKHRVVVDVPASAIDADTGAAVGTAFTLQSPATGTSGAHTVFASPLTTLVQAHVDATGATLAAATEFVKTQAGLAISPLEDFTTRTDADAAHAAKVARLVQITAFKQDDAVAEVVGTVDLNGSTITQADLSRVVTQAVVAALPTVASLARDPAVADASGAQLQQALQVAAEAVVAQTGLTKESAIGMITGNKLPPDAAAATTPTGGAVLSALRWTDRNTWYYRILAASAADDTPDANGKVRYYELHQQSAGSNYSANGVVHGWAYGNTEARSGDLHWNGSAWVACALGDRYTTTVRDAQGRNSYDYCDGYEQGAGVRSSVDLGGKTIASVFVDSIRKYPGGAGGVAYSQWGPADPAAAFGGATFPAGARLHYQTNTVTATSIAYDVQPAGVVGVYSAEVAAGGDARTGTPACAVPANQVTTDAATLEDLVARLPGAPCVFGKSVVGADSSLDPNEWWSNSTVSLGTVFGGATLPAGTGNWYSTELRLRVAFAPTGNATTYYRCLSRATNASARNCTVIGSGTYAIQNLGDARVMTFAGVPADARNLLKYDRVFVERGGKVYYGFKNQVGAINNQLRLNLEATNAVFQALGLPPVQPTTRLADLDAASVAALATAKGAFSVNSDTDALFFRFGDGGRFLMAQASPENTQTREVSGLELGWLSYKAADGSAASLLELDTNLTAGTSHSGPDDPITGLQFSATGMTVPGAGLLPRANSVADGIVGVWAASATELRTQHFVFYPNGRVLMIDPLGDTSGGACTLANQGPPGVEYASYTFDAATGALHVFGKVYDTNGCAGFFDSSPGSPNTEENLTVVISADGKTASVGGGLTLYRISP